MQFLVESQQVDDKTDYDENRNLILKSICFKKVVLSPNLSVDVIAVVRLKSSVKVARYKDRASTALKMNERVESKIL